jgi:hypothetical protein
MLCGRGSILFVCGGAPVVERGCSSLVEEGKQTEAWACSVLRYKRIDSIQVAIREGIFISIFWVLRKVSVYTERKELLLS